MAPEWKPGRARSHAGVRHRSRLAARADVADH
jgi:hypothetical protein